jgi:hypothetical protein
VEIGRAIAGHHLLMLGNLSGLTHDEADTCLEISRSARARHHRHRGRARAWCWRRW